MIVGLFTEGALPWIVAGVVGFPVFFMIIAASTLFLGGSLETYESSPCTLTYRELLALESARPLAAGNSNPSPKLPAGRELVLPFVCRRLR